MVHGHPTIVFVVVAEFGTYLSSFDARHVPVCLSISYLDDKRLNSVIIDFTVFVRNQASGHNDGEVGGATKFSWPPLGGINLRRV